MKKQLLLLGFLLLSFGKACAFTPLPIPTNFPPLVIQDPKDKVVYYVE